MSQRDESLNSFQNLYEVRKTVRFELLNQSKFDLYKFEENILEDIKFLNYLLNFEPNLQSIERSNGKKLQDLLDNDLMSEWLKHALQVLKNQICTLVYNKVAFDISKEERNDVYMRTVIGETGREFSFFIDKEYINKNGVNSYIPEEHFYKVKDSEIWYAIKLIVKLILDNNLESDEEQINTLKKINKYNLNRESLFELNTLNPYTVNRWKITELEKNYKITFGEYKNKITQINKDGVLIAKEILDFISGQKNIDEKDTKIISYFKFIFSDCKDKFNDNIININHIILFINKYGSFKTLDTFKKNTDIENGISKLNRDLRELNKIKSQMFGYQLNLIDNFGIEKFSFLVKSGDYYFVCNKKFETGKSNVTNFNNFITNLDKGDDILLYLDSMTWGGFKKMFISKYSDIVFTDETKITDLEEYKSIITQEEHLNTTKVKIKEDVLQFKKDVLSNIDTNKIKDFFEYLGINKKNLVLKKEITYFDRKTRKQQTKTKRYFDESYKKDLINFFENNHKLREKEEKYVGEVKSLLSIVKTKKYKIGGELKDLSFLGDLIDIKGLKELENHFNDSGYKVVKKEIDIKTLLNLPDLEIYQIKSKDFPFYEEYINENNCGVIDTAKNNKKLERNKKDLNTIYFESFFEDIGSYNKYARIGADYKVRGVFASDNNDYSNFWNKKKNAYRHIKNKESIESFVNRFKRDRQFVEFTINLNATKHRTDIYSFNDKVNTLINSKGEIKILSLDHGESSFLTFKKLKYNGTYTELRSGNFDDWKLNQNLDSINKKQKIPDKEDIKNILDNYVTKYHYMIQEQKRVRQVQEGLKSFVNFAISRIKEIISSDSVAKNTLGVSDKTKKDIKSFLEKITLKERICDKKKKEYTYTYKQESIFAFLNNFKFDYCKYEFKNTFPDQQNLKDKIDDYILGIKNLLGDDKKIDILCQDIKNSFDGKSIPNYEKLRQTCFYSYRKNFNLSLKQINNLKKGYNSVLIGYISKEIMSGNIDIICLENNILTYGVEKSTAFKSHMGATNHPIFIQALMNKLSFCLDKNTGKNYQFCFPVQSHNTKFLKDKSNGILFFIDEENTSKDCPKCGEKLCRNKNNGEDELVHKKNYKSGKHCDKLDNMKDECDFHVKKSIQKTESCDLIIFKDGDDLATYNIAKKGLEYLQSKFVKDETTEDQEQNNGIKANINIIKKS